MKSFLFISSFLVLLSCTSNATQSSKIPKEIKQAERDDLKVDFNKLYRSNYPRTEFLQTGIYKSEAYFRDEDELEQDFLNDSWLGISDLIISSNFDGCILYLSGEAKEQRIVEPVFYEPMTGGC